MGIKVRATLTAFALLLAAPVLRADQGDWSGGIGAVQPLSGAKQWVNATTGPYVDILETFALTQSDFIRMRFGFWTLKSSTTSPQDLVLPGETAAGTFPASTTNELYGFTYGGEYYRNLPARTFVFGGLGVTYLTATRKGAFDLTSAGSGSASANYGANNFVPYFTAGLGVHLTRSLDLEARWQTATLKAQTRGIDLSSAGYTTAGTALVPKLTLSTVSVGLTVNF